MQKINHLEKTENEKIFSGYWSTKDISQQAVLECLEDGIELTKSNIKKQGKKVLSRFKNQANDRQVSAQLECYRIDSKIINDADTINGTYENIFKMVVELKANGIKTKIFKLYHLQGMTVNEIKRKIKKSKKQIEYSLNKCYDFLAENSSLIDLTNSHYVFGKQNVKRNFLKHDSLEIYKAKLKELEVKPDKRKFQDITETEHETFVSGQVSHTPLKDYLKPMAVVKSKSIDGYDLTNLTCLNKSYQFVSLNDNRLKYKKQEKINLLKPLPDNNPNPSITLSVYNMENGISVSG